MNRPFRRGIRRAFLNHSARVPRPSPSRSGTPPPTRTNVGADRIPHTNSGRPRIGPAARSETPWTPTTPSRSDPWRGGTREAPPDDGRPAPTFLGRAARAETPPLKARGGPAWRCSLLRVGGDARVPPATRRDSPPGTSPVRLRQHIPLSSRTRAQAISGISGGRPGRAKRPRTQFRAPPTFQPPSPRGRDPTIRAKFGDSRPDLWKFLSGDTMCPA